MKPLRTVALLARRPGLRVLGDALINSPTIDLLAVYSHRQLPRAEGGGVRPEAYEFENLCRTAGITLKFLDSTAAKNLDQYLPSDRLDLLIAVSWRFLVPSSVLERVKMGAVNLHRGALPAYAGAQPVLRAIKAGDRRVAITAHRMAEAIDSGPIICQVWLDIDPCPVGEPAARYAEAIKKRLESLYAPLALMSIAAVSA